MTDDEFLTANDVAALLKVNELTVRNWLDRGQITALRIGPRRVRFRRSDINAFIEARNPTVPEALPAPEVPPGWVQLAEQREDIIQALKGFIAASEELLRALEPEAGAPSG